MPRTRKTPPKTPRPPKGLPTPPPKQKTPTPSKRPTGAVELSKQEKLFAAEYVVDLNGTQAILRAGYKMTEASAAVHACRLLGKPKIQTELARLQAARLADVDLRAIDILMELKRIALSDPRQIFKEDGTLKDPKDWSDDVAHAIASIEHATEVDKAGIVTHIRKVKWWDKNSALLTLAKHLNLLKDASDLPLSGRVTLVWDDGTGDEASEPAPARVGKGRRRD